MSILDKITAVKRLEVDGKRSLGVYERYKRIAGQSVRNRDISMSDNLRKSEYGIIAEFKRRSPSKGTINESADVAEVVSGYFKNGASACSVLTDTPFFGGSLSDLAIARNVAPGHPILRKEFIISEEQIYEASVFGANAILLIASILSPEQVDRFAALAHSLSMEVLLEIHDKSEINHYVEGIEMIGVNNRNLATFSTDISNSTELLPFLPDEPVKVAESGITTYDDLLNLREAGFGAFLIGERFMKNSSPADALKLFLKNE